MNEYAIRIYKAESRKCPFNDWLSRLTDKKAQVAIDLRLERLRMGNFGNCRSLRGMLFELKIDLGPGYRIYFGKLGNQLILLLCAGNKKTQIKDIERARKYLQDFKKMGT